MKIPEAQKNIVETNKITQEEWSVMPFGTDQYWIVHKDDGKTTFIATVEDSGDDQRNSAVALLLSKAPQLLKMLEAVYSGMETAAMEKTIIYYMIKDLLNQIKDDETTTSIRNT